MQDLFSELLRVSIGHQKALSRCPDEKEWVVLFGTARKQAVVGVTFYAVRQLPPEQVILLPASLKMEWLALTAQIQTRNEYVNRKCIELQQSLADEGLKSCILKGQGVAMLYQLENENAASGNKEPYSLLRQSGDIDVWVDAERCKVIDYVMAVFPTREFDQKHIHYHVFENVEVEMHWIPVKRNSPKFNRVLDRYFNREKSRQFANRMLKMCVPTIDFQLVHQVLHVYAHYVYEGVGFRQIMDLYFTQKAFVLRMENEAKGVTNLFEKLGLMKFVAGTQYVLQSVFGMDERFLLCLPDKKEGLLLLVEMERGGNFGQYDERNRVSGESFVHRALRRFERRWRMVRFDPWGTILMPFSRVWLEMWMRMVRRKYGV